MLCFFSTCQMKAVVMTGPWFRVNRKLFRTASTCGTCCWKSSHFAISMLLSQNGSFCTYISQLHRALHTRTTYSQRKNIPRVKATADSTARSVIMYYIRHGNISTKKDNMRQSHARLKEKAATRSSPLLKSAIKMST